MSRAAHVIGLVTFRCCAQGRGCERRSTRTGCLRADGSPLRARLTSWRSMTVEHAASDFSATVAASRMTHRLATAGAVFGLVAIVNLVGCVSRDLPPAPPSKLTFEQRCADPATVKCVGFDSPAEVDRFVYPTASTNTKRGQVVTDVKASGAGSLRFEVPS